MKRKSSRLAVIDCRLVAGFARMREKLSHAQFAERLDRELAFWARPSDRRLPLALIDRSVRDLLATPFDDLHETPGIGPKKLATLICLLERVAQDDPCAADTPRGPGGSSGPALVSEVPSDPLDLAVVANLSDALWSQWRETVERCGLRHETLGRFAASLQELPRVLWRAPLGVYLALSLPEIRALKAHGEKRVGAVLAIFGSLHDICSRTESFPHLTAAIMPTLVARIESWFARRPTSRSWTAAELRESWITPLLEQLRIDAGELVVRLVECRLHPAAISIQKTARGLGLTRGRVYELLSDVETVLVVRWPEGRAMADALASQLDAREVDDEALALFESARRVFFPARQDTLSPLPAIPFVSDVPNGALRGELACAAR